MRSREAAPCDDLPDLPLRAELSLGDGLRISEARPVRSCRPEEQREDQGGGAEERCAHPDLTRKGRAVGGLAGAEEERDGEVDEDDDAHKSEASEDRRDGAGPRADGVCTLGHQEPRVLPLGYRLAVLYAFGLGRPVLGIAGAGLRLDRRRAGGLEVVAERAAAARDVVADRPAQLVIVASPPLQAELVELARDDLDVLGGGGRQRPPRAQRGSRGPRPRTPARRPRTPPSR